MIKQALNINIDISFSSQKISELFNLYMSKKYDKNALKCEYFDDTSRPRACFQNFFQISNPDYKCRNPKKKRRRDLGYMLVMHFLDIQNMKICTHVARRAWISRIKTSLNLRTLLPSHTDSPMFDVIF